MMNDDAAMGSSSGSPDENNSVVQHTARAPPYLFAVSNTGP